jgi:hypothetical protein
LLPLQIYLTLPIRLLNHDFYCHRSHLLLLLAADPLLASQSQVTAAGLQSAAGRPPTDFGLPPSLAAGRGSLEAAVELARLCLIDGLAEASTPAQKLAQLLRLVAHLQDKVEEFDQQADTVLYFQTNEAKARAFPLQITVDRSKKGWSAIFRKKFGQI